MFCQPHQLGHLWMNHIFMLTLHQVKTQIPKHTGKRKKKKRKKKREKKKREKNRLTVLHRTCKHKQYQHLRSLTCNREMYFQEGSLRRFCTHFKNTIYQITSIYIIYMTIKLVTITRHVWVPIYILQALNTETCLNCL